jgi:hypothetical protein
MSDASEQILKFCESNLNPADNAALKDMLNSSAQDDELSTEVALQALSFLRDKLPMTDMTKLIGLLGESIDYTPAEDDFDRDADGVPLQERKAAGLAGQDDPPAFAGRPTVGGVPRQDRRHRRRPRSFTQMAFDVVLRRSGNKSAAKAEADAAAYLRRFPEAARLGAPLPNYGAPRAARTPLPTTRAQDKSYANRFPDTTRIQH